MEFRRVLFRSSALFGSLLQRDEPLVARRRGRLETEKRGKLLQEAAKKKAPPAEACGLFTRFIEAEGKMVKYMTANQTECRIPPDTIKNIKAAHEKSTEMRGKVCEAAKSPKPAGPSLSDALGIRTPLPD